MADLSVSGQPSPGAAASLPELIFGPRREGDVADPFYPRAVLKVIDGRSLFYPCSGNDLLVPIRLFAPHVRSFWFVDKGYFAQGDGNTHRYGLDRPADEIAPILSGRAEFEFLGATVSGPPRWPGKRSRHDHEITPCVRREIYRHVPSGRQIAVHLRRGYGYSGFLKEDLGELGVFFYRGDSWGEGGSGAHWLHSHMDVICSRLVENGLLVTDGPSKWRRGEGRYAFLCDTRYRSPQELAQNPPCRRDRRGRVFRCIGYAGHRYGATLIWQLSGLGGSGRRRAAG